MPNKEKRLNLSSEDLCFTPAVELRDMIRKKLISPVELVETFLERIEKVNPEINAYCTVASELARKRAKEIESAIMRGDKIGPLGGIPVSIKDVTLTAGIRTTFGSKLYENFVPAEDELIVERIKKAGGIIIGKTNTPEFASVGATFNDLFGITRNPWNTDFSVGGSSGGAAAAVAAGLGPLAQGNDLGGSVRIPASFCGVVGLRPSPGRIPWYPHKLHWDDLMAQGPIARTVGDIALMLDAVSGPDNRSPVSLPAEKTGFLRAAKNPEARNLKIAWGGSLNLVPVKREILEIARSAIKVFRSSGSEVVEAQPDFSGIREVALTYRGLSYVAQYHDQMDTPEFKRLVGPIVKGHIERGLKLSVQDIARAQRRRSEIWEKVSNFFDKYDLLLTPTLPIPPFPAETQYPTEIDGKPMENPVDWVMMTYAMTMMGLPAISVPCGWTENGLPVGLQIVGRRYGEAALLQAAAAYESAAPWKDRRPPLG
jgi:Asp-tRNA(Asn)/Glu-tRNA(Gln) amidotransferase A subunit family amidase